ncbi:Fructosamine kinase-domain-containing protein [Diplogelasinospora grovesii]|uniref:protein-ribulosamine 3-kinase n=1 Tax=Diplogelasinospora grovesii TaxID=303347 RepID=A0AAN6MZY4_9PEZI|nr:Fructosamine kinase-domain-containing protein [Diplogelasinospora grovesii]
MNYDDKDIIELGLEIGNGNTKLDPSVIAELPKGCRVIATECHGVSFWASTGQIEVELADGETTESFFIKVISKDTGKGMVHGEFESMKAIHAVLPDFAPRPIAWGTYQTIPQTYFFLCEFRYMCHPHQMPDPVEFSHRLATIHKESQSPTGKFGFHVTTFAGNLPQMVEWEDSWETFFSKSLREALDLEIAQRGGTTDPELEELAPVIFDKVIPRLLRPLESDGRSVKPSLIHGDLWYANSGVDDDTGDSLIFDACCFYAHNEYEFGQWRPTCNRFGSEYLDAYYQHAMISEPEQDFDGRVDLYKLRFNTHVSALFSDNPGLHEQMLGDMRDLAQRYGQEAIPAKEPVAHSPTDPGYASAPPISEPSSPERTPGDIEVESIPAQETDGKFDGNARAEESCEERAAPSIVPLFCQPLQQPFPTETSGNNPETLEALSSEVTIVQTTTKPVPEDSHPIGDTPAASEDIKTPEHVANSRKESRPQSPLMTSQEKPRSMDTSTNRAEKASQASTVHVEDSTTDFHAPDYSLPKKTGRIDSVDSGYLSSDDEGPDGPMRRERRTAAVIA